MSSETTIFEKIVAGQIPCFKLWENEKFLAFLDINPVAPGHCLVIPKAKVDPVFAMEDGDFQEFFLAAKQVAALLKSKISCERVCLSVVGFEVPHAHIHLIPCHDIGDFPWPGGKKTSMDELKEIQSKILAN